MSDDDTYTRHHCPKCSVLNVVACGDPQDVTSTLGEEPACKCWYCDHKFWRFDMTDSGVLEGFYDYDPDKSLDENLKECGYEDGEPDEGGNAEYERFLDSPCSERKGSTWRGYIVAILTANTKGDKDHPPLGVFAVDRPGRIAAMKRMLTPKDKKWRQPMAEAFCKADGMDIRGFTNEKNAKGGYKRGPIEWDSFYRKLEGLICYIMRIEHGELGEKE